jgi:hypothetical protein
MLSPNAMYLRRDSCACLVTVTRNWHDAWRFSASVAVQPTVVIPIGKIEPDSGEQDTFTGGCPLVAAGVAKLTSRPLVLMVLRAMSLPHDTVGASGGGGGGGGGVGAVGLLQPATARSSAKAAARNDFNCISTAFDCTSPPLFRLFPAGIQPPGWNS